ncbi:MAG: methyltransferase domain-containing protein [Bacteroidota bacterium]
MPTVQAHKIIQKKIVPPSVCLNDYTAIRNYYDVAGPDYETWSPRFNMHFGYCRKLTDIFRLEKMLVNMNEEVLKMMQIDPAKKAVIADLGCGVGTVARHAAKKFPLATITAITISDYQVQKGNSLIKKENLCHSVSIVKNNFENLDFPNKTFTHAYALESACHAGGSGKELFIAEMARVLQTGGRFCIADGFLKHDKKLPRLFSYLYKKIIRYWALPCFAELGEFKSNLEKYGLEDITAREISLHIAPSVAYVPWTCIKFFAKEIWKNKSLRMKKERWHNVYAPVLGMILGLYRRHFGYYIISGKKK